MSTTRKTDFLSEVQDKLEEAIDLTDRSRDYWELRWKVEHVIGQIEGDKLFRSYNED